MSNLSEDLLCLQICMCTAEQASQSGHRQSAMFGDGAICQLRNRSLSLSAAPDARIHWQEQGTMPTSVYNAQDRLLAKNETCTACYLAECQLEGINSTNDIGLWQFFSLITKLRSHQLLHRDINIAFAANIADIADSDMQESSSS